MQRCNLLFLKEGLTLENEGRELSVACIKMSNTAKKCCNLFVKRSKVEINQTKISLIFAF